MASIFQQLKSFIESNYKVRIGSPDYNIYLDSDNPDPASYSDSNKSLCLNLSKFSPDDIKIFKPIMHAIIASDGLLVEDESQKLVNDILSEEQANAKLLSFIKDKIPTDDFAALRSALYVRKCFRQGSNVKKVHALKEDIIYRYGSRGKSISNLCSTGYFESLIIPMYNEMIVKQRSTYEEFLKAYNFIINESAFAVFISAGMTLDVIEDLVTNKIKRNFRYGIKYISIHGIGHNNIENIRSMIALLEKRYSIRKKDIIEKDNIITARIYFN